MKLTTFADAMRLPIEIRLTGNVGGWLLLVNLQTLLFILFAAGKITVLSAVMPGFIFAYIVLVVIPGIQKLKELL